MHRNDTPLPSLLVAVVLLPLLAQARLMYSQGTLEDRVDVLEQSQGTLREVSEIVREIDQASQSAKRLFDRGDDLEACSVLQAGRTKVFSLHITNHPVLDLSVWAKSEGKCNGYF